MYITTITPVRYPLSVRQGVNEFSAEFRQLLQEMAACCPELEMPDWPQAVAAKEEVQKAAGSKVTGRPGYSNIKRDDFDIRMFMWKGELSEGHKAIVHFFNNNIAVIEIDLAGIPPEEAEDPGHWAEDRTREAIAEIESQMVSAVMARLKAQANPNLEINDVTEGVFQSLWIGSTLRLTKQEVKTPEIQSLIRSWLADTVHPEDAEDIIAERASDSLTWLNYVLVEDKFDEDHYKLEAMILAQYFYSVQDLFNRELFQQISDVFLEKDTNANEQRLKQRRAQAQLHVSNYFEVRKYLIRKKHSLLKTILSDWNFEDLLQNTERMIKVCSSRLEEIRTAQRERSAKYTDYLLVAIGFFAIFDLALTFISYSREVMTNPTLSYRDEGVSSFLLWVAGLDIDLVMLLSLAAVIALIGVYFRVKES